MSLPNTRALLLRGGAALFFAALILNGLSSGHAQNPTMVKDPVCGMSVDSASAKFKSEYEGKTYYFCSEGCKINFDKEPARYLSQKTDEALAALKEKFEKNSQDMTLALKYGDGLIKGSQWVEAKALFEKLKPTAVQKTDQADIIFQLGYIAMKERKYDEALAYWKTVRDNYADTRRYSHATVNTAAILYQINDKIDPAFSVLSPALKNGRILDEHLPTAYKLMLMMSYDTGDYASAKAYLEKMPAIQTDDHIYDSIWVIYLKTGETAKGEKMLTDLYTKIQDDFFALYRLASIASDASIKLPEALTWIERSNEMSKGEKFYVLDTYATLLFKTGQKEKAVLTLENAIRFCKRADAKKEMEDRLEIYKKALKSAEKVQR